MMKLVSKYTTWYKSVSIVFVILSVFAVLLSGCTPVSSSDTNTESTAGTTATSATSIPPIPVSATMSMKPPAGLSAIEGKMLWPTQLRLETELYSQRKYLYGIIDENCEVISPIQYTTMEYFKDEQGRYLYLTASYKDHTDIYTMDGAIVMSLPCEAVEFSGDMTFLFVYFNQGHSGPWFNSSEHVTLYNFKTKKQLLQEEYAEIKLVDAEKQLFWIATPDEKWYIFDANKAEDARIPMEGYPFGVSRDGALISASTENYYERDTTDVLCGFLGLDGKWVISPIYEDSTDFAGEYAGVCDSGTKKWYFIDRNGQIVDDNGGEGYQYISVLWHYGVGFPGFSVLVYEGDPDTVCLDKNLQPTDRPESSIEGFYWKDDVLYLNDDKYEFVPARYQHIVHSEWPVLIMSDYDGGVSYWANVETGQGKALRQRYYNVERRSDMLCCHYYVEIKQGEREKYIDVYDLSGNLLDDTIFNRFSYFRTEIYERGHADWVIADRYYWVETAQYHGYIDETGKWLYKDVKFGIISD